MVVTADPQTTHVSPGRVRPVLRWASALAWIPAGLSVALHLVGAITLALWVQRLLPTPHLTLLAVSWVAAALAFVLVLPILVILSTRFLGLHNHAGSVALTDPHLFAWYHRLLHTYLVHATVAPAWRAVGMYRVFARGMGAHVGRHVILNTTEVYDHDLLTIEDGALIGGDATLLCHVAEHGHLERAPIYIGAGATIGMRAIVLPGARIGKRTHVGAGSLVPKHAVLEDDATYAGVPVRRVG